MSIFEKVSLGISIIALIISLAVYFKNKLYSSASLEATIFAQISLTKIFLTLLSTRNLPLYPLKKIW